MKANLKGSGGIKGLALRHGEKIVITIAALLAGWFGYKAVSLSHLEDRYQAPKLQQEITQTNTVIDDAKWPDKPEEVADIRVFKPVAKNAGVAIKSEQYGPFSGLDAPVVAASTLRTDPVILTAVELKVYGSSGLLSFRDESIRQEQERRLKLKEDEKRKKEEKTTNDAGQAGLEGAQRPGGRGRNRPGEGPDAAVFDPDHPERKAIEGIASPAGVPLAGGERLERAYWATIVAKVPIREQLKLFQDAFQNARGGYDPARDFPRYIGFLVEKSEVVPGQPEKWATAPVYDGQGKSIPGSPIKNYVNDEAVAKLAAIASAEWAGAAIEPVDARWTDPMLTMPLPPLVGRDFGADATHPDIPLAINAPPPEDQLQATPTNEPAATPAGTPEDDTFSAGGPNQVQGGVGPSPYAGPPGGARGFGGPREFAGGGPREAGPRGMGGGPQIGAVMSGGIATGQRTDLPREVDFLLLRFFDFNVKPGMKYKYRVRLVVADPNYGILKSAGVLDPSVLDRQDKEARDAKAKNRPAPSHRLAEFSEPSATVGIPPGGGTIYAGVAKPGAGKANDEPSVMLMAEAFDIDTADNSVIHVAHEAEFHRGSVINLDEEMKYTGENDRWIATKDSKLDTGLTLLDMVGGEKVEKSTAPSRVLLMDVAGQLTVRDELTDKPDVEYLHAIFSDDKKKGPRTEGPGGEFGGPRGGGPQRPGGRGSPR